MVFLDDQEHVLFVRAVSLGNLRITTVTPCQYNVGWNIPRYSPLKIATPLGAPLPDDARDHLSEHPVPLSGFPCSPKNK